MRIKVLSIHTVSANIEKMGIEFYQIKQKWVLLGVDKPPIQNHVEFTEEMTNTEGL